MNNGFIFVAIGFVIVVGGWSIFLSVALDKSMAEVKKLKQELKDLIPF
jgi:uncharacterized protein YjeT (DUF2065 family)